VVLLGIAAPIASAAPSATTAWVYQTSFGAGEFGSTFTPQITGVAVEGGSGNILVPDVSGQVRVYAPDPLLGGTPLTTFASKQANNIAVDRATGAVYVNEPQETEGFRRYLSDGAPTPAYTLDPGFAPTSDVAAAPLVIDPTTNDVLALVGGFVKRFDPETGGLISSFPIKTSSTGQMTVGLDGTIYVGGGNNQILRFNAAGTQLSSFPLPPSFYSGATGLALDPATGNVLAVVNSNLLSFTPSGEKVFEVPVQPSGTHGLAVDPVEDRLYIRADTGNPYDTAGIDTYVPAPYAGVEVPSASGITTTSFHVTTEVDPGEKAGGGVPDNSAMHFEYRLAGEPGWTSTPDQAVSAAGTFEADITGLGPNLTYEVRAVAGNSQTTHVTEPAEVTTTTVPPTTETGGATDVTETSAVLNGTINPVGLQTAYYFEYGTTTAYGSRIPAGIEAVAGGGRDTKIFSRTIRGLTPGTTYHFRLVATSSAGTSDGADRTFTTVVPGGIPPRAYEQVTPVDKEGRPTIPRLGFQAAPGGGAVSYSSKSGTFSSPAISRFVSIRGSSDWNSGIATDPPLNAGSGGFLIIATLGVSDDFTHALVVSSRALAPGAIENGANLYMTAIGSNEYELVAATNAPGAFNSFTGSKQTGKFLGGAPDYSWVIFSCAAPLLPNAPADAMYRWSEAGGLEAVSVLPDGDIARAVRGSASSVYDTMSADGSRLYFSAVDSSEEGVFLREDGGPAKPVSVSRVPGDPDTPQPAVVLGVNEDGRYAFLTSPTKLTSDAPGLPGDLYRYDAVEETLEYLGARAYVYVPGVEVNMGGFGVSPDGDTFYFNSSENGGLESFSVWHQGTVHTVFSSSLGSESAFPSPNRRYVAAQQNVEGVPNVIQVYDAETGELSCVSCLSDGTPVSASLPNGGGELYASNRYPQAVTDDGTVYFDTAARLVAADVNGTIDVYSYRDGIVRLVSPGNRSFDAILGDISADGSDVYFTTQQKLVGRDNDEQIDVYDARVNGGLPAQSPPPPQECLRDDCKATPNAGPELPFGGSEALSGPENVKPVKQKKCGKGKRAKKVKGKVRCVKKHKASKNKKGGNR
jgi:Tol biopolymer transport system component